MSRYNKLIAAVVAGLVVAVPLLSKDLDGGVSATEWLEILGVFLPAVFVGLSPANKQTTGDLVDQVNKNPDLILRQATVVSPISPTQAKINRDPDIKPLA